MSPPPKIPAKVEVGYYYTVSSVKAGGPRYRVWARRDPEDSGITVVAVIRPHAHSWKRRQRHAMNAKSVGL